jgi:hypothetical protein
LGTIIDAVAKAYEQEVIYAQKSSRLVERDLRAKSLQVLTNEVQEKMQLINRMAAEANDSPDVKILKFEIDVLTEQMQELRRRLKRDDLEARSPSRIRQVQAAVVSPE